MSETDVQPQAPTEPVPSQEPQALDPYSFLAKFPNAPTRERVESWKQQVPGGRVRLKTSSDYKRIYLMRAMGGAELAQVQARLPQNMPPERYLVELQLAVTAHCCLWTNVAPDGKLTEEVLRASGAGLPSTLHEVVSVLSDYENPDVIERLSADL